MFEKDLALDIADLKNPDETMIVEFPNEGCSGVCSSLFVNDMKKARNDFLSSPPVVQLGAPSSKFKKLSKRVVVELIGPGFWDFSHHQTGRAPNDIEIHPVIAFKVIS